MESEIGLRWRNKALKIVETKRRSNEEEEDEPLSPTARLFHEPNLNVYIIAIVGCKTQIYPEVVKDNLVHTLLKHPRFSSLQVMDDKNGGELKWVRTVVDLEKHVIVPEVDPVMDSPEKFVEDYIYNLTKSTIDKSRPLWDLHLLNVRTSESEAVGVFRIHHSLGDGTSLMSLVLACTRQIENPEALPTVPTKKRQEKNEGRGFRRFSFMLLSFFSVFWNTVIAVFMFLVTVLFLKDTDNPLKGRAGVEFSPRRIVHRTVSLDDIKLVKNAMNTTINDVALGITQAGFSRYINRIYGGTETKNNLPKKLRFRSVVLVNIRPTAGIQALADMMEKDTGAAWGNWIGYIILPFTIAIQDDPLDYVRKAKATIDRKKNSLEALFTFTIAEVVFKLFGIKAAGALWHRAMSHTTMAFSNLVGPVEEIGFYGHPISFLAPSCYDHSQALMIHFQSYTKKMTIVVSVDEETIPNPHLLCDDIVESLKLIKNTVEARELHQ